ncbi:MAG: protein kinase [Stigonema ocellatum SAG 48.90 = DSM 106950]|nr:protein kinase [Stigonema ocellatum SAG 48.90 = DSM 106950]
MTPVNIPGYQVSEELYNGSRTLIYRGYRETDSLPVVIKLLKNPYPSFWELVKFRNQYTIAKNLNSPLIVQTYSLEPYQNGYGLVMEDFGGISLKEWVVGSREWGVGGSVESLMKFLEIAIALCNALDILYRAHIIHKDIKPANILINPETKQVKLIDFSIASLLPRETQTSINPNVLEGTLAYISPEQTGRMNRLSDYRTDFYSLGVTFHELLTGELPFQSNDAMELVHCHIAKKPRLVHEINPQIPELEKIIGQQPPALELSGTAAQNRFNLLFQKFTQVFATAAHPLVMFLDDLQWADSASLKLMQLLMANTGHLLLIGAYRDREVSPAHPLMLTLSEIEKAQTTINTITLAPLSQGQVNQLVADTLKCTENVALPLSQLVAQKTQGNPFFATQFLKALHQDGFIQFNFLSGCWQCDMAQVNQLAVTDDVVAFMAFQLRRLPSSTQNVLQLAACIGNQFDLGTLAIVSGNSEIETAACLWKALQFGLILPLSDVYKFYQDCHGSQSTVNNQPSTNYKFLHDRVQQAAYSLIPDEQKKTTHHRIGQQLLKNTSDSEQEERIFEIVNQINLAVELIEQPTEREELAKLNLIAGRKAKNSTAYSAAVKYFAVGRNLLASDRWQNQYKLTLPLYVEATEAAYLNTDIDEMEALAEVVLQQAKTALDTVKVYGVRINAYTSQGQLLEAINTGLTVLKQFEIDVPESPDLEDVAGVAHEMNNPLGFIAASLQQAKPTVADIVAHLKLYQDSLPNPGNEIKDHAEEIDLEYSLEDLPKIIDSMVMACDRLENISTSLRTFSRADKDYKVPFNIHQGMDSTILILKHRFKANEQRPAIEVVTNYGNLPSIKCFPGQLNQVFMNLLANAIDALEESNHGRSFEEIKISSNRIKITTSIGDNFVKIAILDNGKGMSEEVKEKIFDHSFTTKAVGKGTGLGLAIAQQIIVEKHNGSLTVNSRLGEGTEFVITLPILDQTLAGE